MTAQGKPVSIKKYANRRLYHTGSSTYVTLEDLAAMIRCGGDFVVRDARSGADITRSVLLQIVMDEEAREPHLLPEAFLRDLIRNGAGEGSVGPPPRGAGRRLDRPASERPTASAAPAGHTAGPVQATANTVSSELDRLQRQLDSVKAELDKLARP